MDMIVVVQMQKCGRRTVQSVGIGMGFPCFYFLIYSISFAWKIMKIIFSGGYSIGAYDATDKKKNSNLFICYMSSKYFYMCWIAKSWQRAFRKYYFHDFSCKTHWINKEIKVWEICRQNPCQSLGKWGTLLFWRGELGGTGGTKSHDCREH